MRLALVFVGSILLFDALAGEKGLVEMMQASQEQRALERTLAEALRQNDAIREEIRRLQQDPGAIEDLARRELGLIRKGEKLFMIRDVEPREPKPVP